MEVIPIPGLIISSNSSRSALDNQLIQSYWPCLDLPTFAAFATSDISCHGFIGTPGLHLVIGTLALATPAALEHVSGGLFFLISIMHTSFQAFQLYLNVLTLPLVTAHLLYTHGYKSLRLDLSKKHLPPQIWVLWVFEIEQDGLIISLLDGIRPPNPFKHSRLYWNSHLNWVYCWWHALISFRRNSRKGLLQLFPNPLTVTRGFGDGFGILMIVLQRHCGRFCFCLRIRNTNLDYQPLSIWNPRILFKATTFTVIDDGYLGILMIKKSHTHICYRLGKPKLENLSLCCHCHNV